MHTVLHFICNVGFGIVVLTLVFQALSNLRMAVDAPWTVYQRKIIRQYEGYILPGLHEYLSRQAAGRAGWFGKAVKRECRVAYALGNWAALAMVPDLLLHLFN